MSIKVEKKRRFYRIVSFFVLINIIGDLIFPTCAFALTGGPSQPEFESFEPASTNQMVDLFTGDFNYNIPLLNIPGPNGGYPVNLAYHAGATMEQEASWVGLGWNINPGVINRNMRGLPDDFDGDQIKKEYNLKPREKFDLSFGWEGDKWCGIPVLPSPYSLGISYDNYKGFGIAGSFSYDFISVNYDTQDGMGLQLTASYEGNTYASIGLSIDFNSREGMTSWGVSVSDKYTKSGAQIYAGFAASTQVPTVTWPMNTDLTMFNFKGYTAAALDFDYMEVSGDDAKTKVASNTKFYKGYGYSHMEDSPKDLVDGYLLDFNRENDYPVANDVEALPMPVMTNDVFLVSGEGIGGAFRTHRSDVGILNDPKSESITDGKYIGVEVGADEIVHAGSVVPFILNESDISGRWASEFESINNSAINVDFRSGDESFTFKFLNELNTDEGEERWGINSIVGAESLDMNLVWDDNKHLFVPQILNSFNGGGPAYSTQQYRSTRRKRDKLIEYKIRSELAAIPTGIGRHVAGGSTSFSPADYSTYETSLSPYSYSNNPKHFGELSVVKSDGYRYQYGIPVYQTSQKDAVFSVNANKTKAPTSSDPNHTLGFDTYNSTESTYNTTINQLAYDANSASISNNETNTDEFYQANTLPPYASNYLLTAVYSPDYVDLTGDGPSNDDMGYYVKYNYQQLYTGYNWRTPYSGVFLTKGDYSNILDDKESYMFGTKEVWYLHSIETKTHIAIFKTSDRNDAIEAVENSGSNGTIDQGTKKLKKLDQINLYSQADLSNPIETVNFTYDYSLCKGVYNNINNTDGKLTLKKVSFSYLGNNKGQLSPYIFSYEDSNNSAYQNPNYSTNNTDRWGHYKVPMFKEMGSSQTYMACGTDDYPYVDQNADYDHNGTIDVNSNGVTDEYTGDIQKRNFHASAWCLRQIILPSGGQINIDYEQDDYAYVQDQDATEMFQIVSTGKTDNSITSYNNSSDFSEDMRNDNKRLYFLLKTDSMGHAIDDMQSYLPNVTSDGLSGTHHIYFKTLVELKSSLDYKYMARDYVSGYFDILDIGSVTAAGFPGGKLGFVDVSSIPVDNSSSSGTCHPIRKAAWQHLKLDRTDLITPNTNSMSVGFAILSVIMTIFTDAEEVILGFYHTCQTNEWSRKLELDGHGKPSFIRLKNPTGHKKGGGHRVRRVTYSDNWNQIASDYATANPDTYGQEYSYVLSDGRSSGVASYEPLQGGEENPFKMPSRTYSPLNGSVPFKSRDLYLEKPYGEKYYPAPVVGYSQVTVKNIDRTTTPSGYSQSVISNQASLSGVSVTEFYTAKDFPVRVDVGDMHTNSYAPPSCPIPLVGSLTWENRGYSQGFEIVLNNMHGQLKSQATYAPLYFKKTAYGTRMIGSMASAQAKVEYVYNTNSSAQLDNNVNVLDYDGSYRTALVGQTGEEFIDLRENSSIKDFSWATINFDMFIPEEVPVFCVVPWPSISYSEKMYRSAVHNKVVYQTGILKQVITIKDGTRITMNNLMYDSNTGEPLLTSVTNNFDKPVYTYNKQAYWAYNSMGPAYNNYRYTYNITSISSGVFTVGNGTATHFHLGDVVSLNNTYYWVTNMVANSTNPNTQTDITLTDRNGNLASSVGKLTIMKSGYTNQQDLKMGHIVSLHNPMAVSTTSQQTWIQQLTNAFQNYHQSVYEAGLSVVGTNCNGYFSSDFWIRGYYGSDNPSNYTIEDIDFVDNLSTNQMDYYFTINNAPVTIVQPGGGSWQTVFNCTIPYDFFYSPTVSINIYGTNGLAFYNSDPQFGIAQPNYVPQPVIATLVAAGPLCSTCPGPELGNWQLPQYCLDTKPSCVDLDSVLQVSAMHYTDQWNFNYADIGSTNGIRVDHGATLSDLDNNIAASNPYRFGMAGIWRPLNNWAYIDQRKQGTSTNSHTQINVDGTFKLDEHDWSNNDRLYSPLNPNFGSSASIQKNPNWTFVSEITNYNPYGYVCEKVDALGIYSSTLYGYSNVLKSAEASNSSYYETAFEGFEDHGTTYSGSTYNSSYAGAHGHVALTTTPGTALSNAEYHTGHYSLPFTNNVTLSIPMQQTNAYTPNNTLSNFVPLLGSQKYLLSFWVKRSSSAGSISISCPPLSSTGTSTDLGPIVDGWQKVDYTFVSPSTATPFTIQVQAGNASGSYIDDIRIQPFTSAMKSYVYDPKTLWLLSELDNRNFATFYNYDEEGQVVQVKKETEKGIVTVKTTRNNIRRNLNQ